MKRVFCASISASVLTCASVAMAAPVPTLNVATLVADSDVVALGTVLAVSDTGPSAYILPSGPIAARGASADVLVDQILKGPSGVRSLRVGFVIPDTPIGLGAVSAGTYAVLLLKRDGDHFQFTSPYYPLLGAVPGARATSNEPLGRVIEILATALEAPDATQDLKRRAIFELGTSKHAAAVTALEGALDDRDETVVLAAAAALLSAGDQTALPVAEKALLAPPPSVAPELLHNLRVGVFEGMTTEGAIPGLARLLHAMDPETRRAAALALRRTKSPLALQPLATALEDPDVEVTHEVVMGLSEITGDTRWGPSVPAFRANPERYIAHWKEWRQNR